MQPQSESLFENFVSPRCAQRYSVLLIDPLDSAHLHRGSSLAVSGIDDTSETV